MTSEGLPEYWLISVPGMETCEQSWDSLNSATKPGNLSKNHKFHIPDLKVGTLDQLVGLSDDLAKLDPYVESIAQKVARYLSEVLENQKDKFYENLRANNLDLYSYLIHFHWDLAKYPIKQSLRNITDIISKQVSTIESDLKTRSTNYGNLQNDLKNKEKRETGSLLTRNLHDLVTKDHFVLNSEYLTTLLVVVPLRLSSDWELNYEKITNMIVPRSSQLVFQDEEHGLFTVTLFSKVVDEFKHKAAALKFTVRDFKYSEEAAAAERDEKALLVTNKKKQFGHLVRWLKVNFSECFGASVHVKALRVFVESVLRYGLPVNFQAMLLQPHKKCSRKLRDLLQTLYGHLDGAPQSPGGHPHPVIDIPGLHIADYYPYVYYRINLESLLSI